jgi:serine/threonine-protein kinase RsbW
MLTGHSAMKGLLLLKLPHKVCLQVNTDLSALIQVLAWFDQFNYPALPQKVWLQCQLALAEGFTNAVRHAHKNQPVDTPIDIEVIQFDGTLEIRIWDQGAPFDLHQTLQRMPPTSGDTLGGRGLILMQRLSDKLSYTRTNDDRNCLLLVKKYRDDPEASCR